MKKVLFAIFILICNLKAQTILVLNPSRDASLGYHDNFAAANTNYNNAQQCAAFCIPGSNGGVNTNRALFQFAFSQIPPQATILSAKLSLFKIPVMDFLTSHTLGNSSATLKRVTNSWLDNTVTWNSQPSATSTDQVILPAASQQNQDYIDIDVLSLVEYSIANPSTNFGYLLSLVNENPNRVLMFCSTSYADANKWPKLVIEYCEAGSNEGLDTLPVLQNASLAYQDNFNFAQTNYNESVQLSTLSAPGDLGGVKKKRALISFDITNTNNQTVESATLSLYSIVLHGTNNGHISPNNSTLIKRVTQSWNENTVNWNNQPTTTLQNAVTLANSTSTNQDYTDIDVTQLLNDVILSNQNNGFLLELENEALLGGLMFGSESYPISGKRPKLVVSYCGGNYGGKINSLSYKKIIEESPFSFYPSPNNTGLFSVYFNDSYSINLLDIYDFTGKKVKTIKVNQHKNHIIDLSELENGIYMILTSANEKSFFNKVIINK